MIRSIFFIGFMLALVYVAYLQTQKTKEHDLDKAETQIDQTREEVNKIMEDNEKKLQKKLKQLEQ